jgi:hypothetical protein
MKCARGQQKFFVGLGPTRLSLLTLSRLFKRHLDRHFLAFTK